MNHLRELLDLLDQTPDKLRVEESVENVAHKTVDVFKDKAKHAMVFYMGDIDKVSQLSIVPELAHLPFKSVWFEYIVPGELSPNDGFFGVLALERSDQLVDYAGFVRHKHQWFLIWIVSSFDMKTGHGNCSSSAIEIQSSCIQTTYAISAFCSAMNCINVHRREHKPDVALQKARAKRGKQPLFSYWTLELNGRDGGAAQSFGGTHASPRVHLRRGHPRQYAPGKWTWVQPHAVGNRELGMVHKDYVIGKEMVVH